MGPCPPLALSGHSRHRNNLSAYLIGRSRSLPFRPSTTAVSMSLTGSRFSSESAPRPFSNRPFGVKHFQTINHYLSDHPPLQCRCRSRARASLRNRHQGPSSMGFENEVEQSIGRPCRQTSGGSKATYELTSSIVPRGTSFHRWVELECSPIVIDPARLSCRCDLPGPAELGAVNPDTVHDHGQPARQRHDRFLHPAVPGDLHRPGLEPGPLVGAGQHDLGCFVEHHPHHLVAAL